MTKWAKKPIEGGTRTQNFRQTLLIFHKKKSKIFVKYSVIKQKKFRSTFSVNYKTHVFFFVCTSHAYVLFLSYFIL